MNRWPALALLTGATLACSLAPPDSALAAAAARGDVDRMAALVERGAALDGVDSGSLSPLAAAARSGEVRGLAWLVERGARTDVGSGVNDWLPVEHALHTNQVASVKFLIPRTPRGAGLARALRMAAGYGQAAWVRSLLVEGADPWASTPGEPSILTLAASGAWDSDVPWNGCAAHEATFRLLIEAEPHLVVDAGFGGGLARISARWRGCADLVRMAERHHG